MATSYAEIFDLALLSFTDYKIDELAKISEENLFIQLEGYLKRAILKFYNCKKDLSDRDDDLRQFNCDLDDTEKNILADYLVIAYLDQQILDRRQITGMMQNKNEANRYSEANLLKEKQALKVAMIENVNNYQTIYDLRNNY